MLKNRVLPIGVLLFVCGAAISVYTDGYVFPLCFAALTVSCSLICAIRFLRLRTALVLGLLPLAAFLYVNLYSVFFVPHSSVSGEAYAVVTSEASYYSGRKLVASVTSSDVIKSGKDIVFYSPDDKSITFGDIVYLKGKFRVLDSSPSALAAKTYYSFSGDAYYIDKDDGFFIGLRRRIIEKCDEYLGKFSPVVKAITIADKSGITSSDYKKYSVSGVSHILAVSGLHLTIAVMALYSLIKRKIGSKYIVCALGCFIVFVFLSISAFPVSSVRAGIMLCLMFVSNMITEKRDSFTSLFASVFVILLFNPFAVASLSLQLSFLATLGIIAVSNASTLFRKPASGTLKYLYEYIFVPIRFTLSSLVFTFPVTLTSFGTVSVISPFSSVVVSLLFPFYLSFSYLFCFLSLIFPPAAKTVSVVVVFFAKLFGKTVDFLSSFRYSSVNVESGTGTVLLVISLVCIALMLTVKKKYFAFLFYSSVCVMTLAVSLHIVSGTFSGSRAFYYDSSDGYAVIAVSGSECVYIDDGEIDNSDSLISKAGKTYAVKAVFRTVNASTAAKAEYFMSCMGTETIYLVKTEDENALPYIDKILDLANQNSCDIIYETDFSFTAGDISVTVTQSATEIGRAGEYVCIADGDITGGAPYDEKVILPLCNSALAEFYENAYTYPKGSFSTLFD